MNAAPLLQVRNLRVQYPAERRLLGKTHRWFIAVDDVSFELAAGETLGLVGESGSGKTTLGRAVVRLVQPVFGQILFDGHDITRLDGPELRALRRHFQIVFQDPYGSLDPRMTVEDAIGEALDIHKLTSTRRERRERVAALLKDVGLNASHAERFPHEFSGGQRQRIGIARALAVEPRLIVCDEPVSALDVSVQAQVVNLLQGLQQEHGLAYLFIAHDLAVIAHVSDRIMVMYSGKVVELGDAVQVSMRPLHPYTRALIAAVPTLRASSPRTEPAAAAEGLMGGRPASGCPYYPRCPLAEARCQSEPPQMREIGPGHFVACHAAKA